MVISTILSCVRIGVISKHICMGLLTRDIPVNELLVHDLKIPVIHTNTLPFVSVAVSCAVCVLAVFFHIHPPYKKQSQYVWEKPEPAARQRLMGAL